MNELILRWLNGKRNYTVGALLYKQFGANEEKKELFETGKSGLTEKELLKCLQQLLNYDEVVLPNQDIEKYAPMPEDKDPVLLAFRNDWLPFFTEMNYKRHSLDTLLDDESDAALIKRATLATDIIQLNKKCKAVWLKRDYYIKHGKLPGNSINKEVVVDKVAAVKRLHNVQAYIRQYNKKLRDNPGDARAAVKLKDFEKEYEQLKQLHGG